MCRSECRVIGKLAAFGAQVCTFLWGGAGGGGAGGGGGGAIVLLRFFLYRRPNGQ